MDKAATQDLVVEVVPRHEQQVGFAVLTRRWVLELLAREMVVLDYCARGFCLCALW